MFPAACSCSNTQAGEPDCVFRGREVSDGFREETNGGGKSFGNQAVNESENESNTLADSRRDVLQTPKKT